MHFLMKNKEHQTVLFSEEIYIFRVVICICPQMERGWSWSSSFPPFTYQSLPLPPAEPKEAPAKGKCTDPQLRPEAQVL